ncbi:MAG: lactate utilization protein [Oscillospiraceae bacterium]|nr:lactate utilization protein [Oscillospiraceae bacterium]
MDIQNLSYEQKCQLLQSVCEKLNKNNVATYVVDKKQDVIEKFCQIAPKGSVVGVAGSVSVAQCGLLDYVKSGEYNFVERNVDKDTDYLLCSSNAVTCDGVLYNVDGNANRIAQISNGPKNVVMVVGINKIVANLDEAILRVKTHCAPLNARRLGIETYCAVKGRCKSLDVCENPQMTDGCTSGTRICCSYLVCGQQRVKDRIKIIFVMEELGF